MRLYIALDCNVYYAVLQNLALPNLCVIRFAIKNAIIAKIF